MQLQNLGPRTPVQGILENRERAALSMEKPEIAVKRGIRSSLLGVGINLASRLASGSQYSLRTGIILTDMERRSPLQQPS